MFLTYLFIAIGFILLFFNLPGLWLIFTGFLISSFVKGFEEISVLSLIVYLIVVIISSFVDNLAVIWGAHRYGASKWGMVGAFIGALLGLIIGNIPGVILGPFFGAFLFEVLFAKKETDIAFKAGVGTILGIFLGVVLKVFIASAMIFTWYLQIR